MGSIESNFGKMQMSKCANLQVTNFFAYCKENATYIANIICMKKYGEIGFQKQAAYLTFA
jgi:hypothetical protein